MNKIHKKATIINRIKHLTNQVRDIAGRFEEGSQTKQNCNQRSIITRDDRYRKQRRARVVK